MITYSAARASLIRRTAVRCVAGNSSWVAHDTDRFGNEQGTFLATGGSSFISRAIAPNTLNTSPGDPAHLCDYHLYRVLTAFDVDGGPAAAWLEQPGGGLQYKLIPGYLPNPQFPLIPWLVRDGYLQRVYW